MRLGFGVDVRVAPLAIASDANDLRSYAHAGDAVSAGVLAPFHSFDAEAVEPIGLPDRYEWETSAGKFRPQKVG